MNVEKLPDVRLSRTKRFALRYVDEAQDPVTCEKCEHLNVQSPHTKELKFYLVAGMYPDERLGEIFIKGDKIGGFISGALDALAMTISVGLQHGVPMTAITSKLRHNRFGPSGFTKDKTFPSCTSMFDLVAQFLEYQFPDGKLRDPTKKIVESAEPADPIVTVTEPTKPDG